MRGACPAPPRLEGTWDRTCCPAATVTEASRPPGACVRLMRESSGQAGDRPTLGSRWRDRVFLEPGLVPEEDNA